MHEQVERTIAENNKLKSRIFDALETEKELRAEIRENAANAATPTASATADRNPGSQGEELHIRDEEIRRLKDLLEAKKKENAELVQISDELLLKLEQTKIRPEV